MAASAEPLRVWRTVVPVEWIDYNGHLTEGYYGVAFGDATDAVLLELGFGPDYRDAHGTFYTVETRIRYLREVKEGAEVHTASLILGADARRLHVHHELFADSDADPVATQECMMLHVAQRADGPGVAPMAEPVASAALAAAEAHAVIPFPDHVGKGVRTLR
ncbi:MAG: 4-hydroxybenzoyl-CoA thioesterase [Acidimicrobiaceae bacterium]|nr:4-hydroxybenzoyl-CoA thioesterase [Acidimicrobiaceae bacterium]|tara:strand:- start:63 stop:548 length:486 start_codon:yes stop_codon:yes gene_type:complete